MNVVFDEKKYIRLTVDTPKDFEIAGKIYQNVVKQDGGFIFNELFSWFIFLLFMY